MASGSEEQACYLSGEPTGTGGGRRRLEGEAREEVCGGVMRVESEAVARGKQVFVPSRHIADGCAAREASVNRPSVGYPYIPQVSRTGRKQATTQPHTPGPSSPFWSREDTLRPKIEGSVYAWHL